MSSVNAIEHLFEKIRHLPAERVAEVEDFVDFLSERARRQSAPTKNGKFDFPVMQVDDWPQDMQLGREEIYGNDGR